MFSLLCHGQIVAFLYEMASHAWCNRTIYAFRRDLRLPFIPPMARIPITTRPFQTADAPHFAGTECFWSKAIQTRADKTSRTALIIANIPSCYVSVTSDGSPCYIQWVIAPSANDTATAYRKSHLIPLSDDEVLLEGAFIPKHCRGKKITPLATCQAAEIARGLGARWAVLSIEAWNIASLKGVLASGFHPYALIKMNWRAFKRKISVVSLDKKKAGEMEALWRAVPSLDQKQTSVRVRASVSPPVIDSEIPRMMRERRKATLSG